MAFICSKLKISSLPEGSNLKHIIGIGLLAGIGFTMSIFISILSYENPLYVNEAKLSILISSVLAGLIGYFLLKSFGNKRSTEQL